MSFAWPHVFWALVVPIALLWWELTHRRRAAALARPKILHAEAGAHSLVFTPRPAPASAARPRIWLCLGLALVIAALARPQWGRLEEPVFDQSREILLAIDLSRSMLAEDVKPSRLDRAKLLIQSLLEKLQGERVGLIVFSGTAFLQSPLSADYEILREFLPALGPDFLPEGGSNYGALLETALQAFGASGSADRFMIVLSDGEATDEHWRARLDELAAKGIRVIGLGVGTAGGAMIPDGGGGLVKDARGAVVLSKLESATLQELAQKTKGVYRDASAWLDLAALLAETIEAGRKGQFVEKNTVRLAERFQWPLAFGLWCLFVSFCYEFPVRTKPRTLSLREAPPAPPAGRERPRAPAAALLLLLAPCSLVVAPSPAQAAIKLAPPPAGTAEAAPPGDAASLARIVTRLAARENRTARDWAELGRETVTWGSRLQSQQQPVPAGPVRDALAAVDLGAKLDRSAADWPKLRAELEALLEKKDQEKQDNQPQPQEKDQDKNEQQQNKDQQKQEQKKSDQQQKKDNESKQQENDNAEKNPQSGEQPEQKEQKQAPGESAFGDMTKKEEPPPPPAEPQGTQKVGGEKKEEPPQQLDPALALPLQKLEQLKNQDSPAQLFQLMEGERKPARKPAKDW